MSATINTIPVWKKNSTVAEWLEELAARARARPEQWSRVVVVYQELNKDGHPYKTRDFSKNIPTNAEILATLAIAQFELWETMKGRS